MHYYFKKSVFRISIESHCSYDEARVHKNAYKGSIFHREFVVLPEAASGVTLGFFAKHSVEWAQRQYQNRNSYMFQQQIQENCFQSKHLIYFLQPTKKKQNFRSAKIFSNEKLSFFSSDLEF